VEYLEYWQPTVGRAVRISISGECAFHGLDLHGLVGTVYVIVPSGERAIYQAGSGEITAQDLRGHRFGVHPENAPPGAIVWLAANEMQPMEHAPDT